MKGYTPPRPRQGSMRFTCLLEFPSVHSCSPDPRAPAPHRQTKLNRYQRKLQLAECTVFQQQKSYKVKYSLNLNNRNLPSPQHYAWERTSKSTICSQLSGKEPQELSFGGTECHLRLQKRPLQVEGHMHVQGHRHGHTQSCVLCIYKDS